MKKYEHLIYSAIGLVALFLLLVAANYLLTKAPTRLADLTEGNLYTLSDGTKRILRELDSPVRLKLYLSQGEAVPVQLRSFAQRVEDLVREFQAASGGNLRVERYNPRPDSEEEDAAQLDGMEPQQLFSGEQFYLGLAVSQLDRKQAIPAITPQRERLLEYDLIRAIARVGKPERPTIGLMAGLPVMGERFNPFTRQSSEPWVLANELRREFEVKEVPMNAKEIDKSIGVLLLIHPRDPQPQLEYALDQFVLRGGKLIAFVDPYAYFDQSMPQMPGMPQQASSSALPRLFKAWGVEFDPGKVIADVVFASGGGANYTPTVLSLNRTAFNREDIVTSSIETLLYAFGGAFNVKPAEGLRATTLVESSPNAMLLDSSRATLRGDEAMKGFQPSGSTMPLALRLSGKFKTAFPEGLTEKDKPVPGTPVLRESTAETPSSSSPTSTCSPTARRSTCRTCSAARSSCPRTAISPSRWAWWSSSPRATSSSRCAAAPRPSGRSPWCASSRPRRRSSTSAGSRASRRSCRRPPRSSRSCRRPRGPAASRRRSSRPSSRPSSSASARPWPRRASRSRKSGRTCARMPRAWCSGPRWPTSRSCRSWLRCSD